MRSAHPQARSNTTPYTAAMCLILVTLLLYNPFLTFLGSSANLIVHHPLSYRATVAGSELQRCTSECPKSLLPALTASAVSTAMHDTPAREALVALPDNLAPAISPAVGHNLWFRPPPALC